MTENNAEKTQNGQNQVKVESESTKRERRLIIDAALPSTANSFLGTLTLTVVGLDKVFEFKYQTPELSEVQAKAMQTGFIARFSTVIGGLKFAEDVAVAVSKEIKNLNLGIFPIRSGGTGEAEFTDTVIALAMLSKTEDKRSFLDCYEEIMAETDKATLCSALVAYNEMDEDGKKVATSSNLFKTAKRAVAFAKSV